MVVEIKGTLPQERLPAPQADDAEMRLPTPTVSPPKKQRIASSQTISTMVQRFILNDAGKSADTLKCTRTTVDLFVEAFGDLPVTQITGTTAGDFKDLLLGLPATHGKAKKCLPIRDAVKVAREQGLKTLSGKTTKNHFSRMSALWSILVQREIVSKNPWMKWSFNTTKETDRRCWTDEELVLLSKAQWEHRGISQRTYAGMVNIALYTGLRLGEICNLRCQDIENVQGVACFQVRPHPEEGLSPKSAAGIRLVPIHSQLIRAGILEFLKPDQHFLFPDLATSTSGVRGASFGQAFSKAKTRLGLPAEITFHSFNKAPQPERQFPGTLDRPGSGTRSLPPQPGHHELHQFHRCPEPSDRHRSPRLLSFHYGNSRHLKADMGESGRSAFIIKISETAVPERGYLRRCPNNGAKA